MKLKTYLFASIAVLALAPGGLTAQQPPPQQQAKPQQAQPEPARRMPDLRQGPQDRAAKRRLRDARLNEGLRAVAKLEGGGYVEEVYFDDELTAADLATLASLSEVVIRGLVKSNWSRLVRGPEPGYLEPLETIVSDYTISVFDVYKGDPGLHSRDITVTIPGGRWEFDGGLWAEVHLTGMLPPLNQDEFILFLQPHESEKNVYSITFSRQGMFQVMPDGWVNPGAKDWSPLYRGSKRDYKEFLEQLREAVGRKQAGASIL